MSSKERREFQRYYVKNKLRLYWRLIKSKYLKMKYTRTNIAGKDILNVEESNRMIREMIQSGKPFCVVRYGFTEMATWVESKKAELGIISEIKQITADTLQRQSGFFPADVSLMPKFQKLMEDSSKSIDALAILNMQMEDYMLDKYIPKEAAAISARALDCFRLGGHQPWSMALKGKRVLVIHPFADTIQKQYARHEKLFDDPNILPDFELHTLKAVQTIVGTKDERFETWFDALQYMYDEAMKIPFDIAILGCGAYGLPLTVMLKCAGKQAIYMGGSTQLLFGIKGRRWDLHFPEVVALYNDYWVRPSEEETPKNKKANEDQGAYW